MSGPGSFRPGALKPLRFPILVSYGRKAELTCFRLRPRTRKGFILADSLALNLEDSPALLPDYLAWAGRFFPGALKWQVDWPDQEREKLQKALQLPRAGYLAGDSWTLPLFLALDCLEHGRLWPAAILASGAVRRARGLRCAAIGGARFKLRRARAAGCRLLLPISNFRSLQRAGWDLSDCLPLPPNLETCLSLWRAL